MISSSKSKGKLPMTINTAAAGLETAPKSYERLLDSAKARVEKASATAFKTYEDLSKFSQENLEAYAAAGTTVAKGFETIGRVWVSFIQETFETGERVADALLSAKTLREAVDMQTDFAKTTFDKLIAEGTKVSEISVKVANEAAEPISARLNAALEKLLKPVAA